MSAVPVSTSKCLDERAGVFSAKELFVERRGKLNQGRGTLMKDARLSDSMHSEMKDADREMSRAI